MLADVYYGTPVLGAVRLGFMEEKGDKRLPKKQDHFSITLQCKIAGKWVPSPLESQLLEKLPKPESGEKKKLREIPIRVLYENPDLNTSERLEAYDREQKRLVCAGKNDGRAKRLGADGKTTEIECPGVKDCSFGKKHGCDMFGRTIFQIEGQPPGFSAYILRSGSWNGVTSLRTTLTEMSAAFGKRMPYVPLKLVLYSKASAQSMGTTFYYAVIELQHDLFKSLEIANAEFKKAEDLGLDRDSWEQSALKLRTNGAFEDLAETFEDREEFLPVFSEDSGTAEGQQGGGTVSVTVKRNGAGTGNNNKLPAPAPALAGLPAALAAAGKPTVEERLGDPICVM